MIFIIQLFASLHALPEAMQTNIQAIDYPYPTANIPSLTIHHALIVRQCVACVHVMIGIQRKMIVMTYPCQTNLVGNSYEMRRY